jgi:hypothetical protein
MINHDDYEFYFKAKDPNPGSDNIYKFQIIRQSDQNYRIYIIQTPGYLGRDESLQITHRYRNQDRFYICWTHPIEDSKGAEAISKLWANGTQVYRNTGISIDLQMNQLR